MSRASTPPAARPRLGFVGVGWIGQARLRAVAESDLAQVAAVADPEPVLREQAREWAPDARFGERMEDVLEADLDGLVIATPSALHAPQTVRALESGLAVFCQKPLGRSARETQAVVEAARRADRLLAVDFCYRHTTAMRAVRRVIRSGELGPIYHARLVFHNAYGPDKAWYYDAASSGGGCLMDLGVHLVDLALWALAFPAVEQVDAALYAGGVRLPAESQRVEDFASARLTTATGAALELACSWNMPAGRDAVISAEFYGPRGGVAFHNVEGSFYDFRAERLHKTRSEVLALPPDAWGGRGIVEFARQLARGPRFDPQADELVTVARLLDRIYGRA